jgi:acetyl esterase/lipase
MPWLFLVASVVGLLFTLNAFRPVRRNRWLFAQSFFGAWLTTELAGHHLFWQLALTALFVWAGALDSVVGWVALGISVVSWIGLVALMVQGFRAAQQLRDALGDLLPVGPAPKVPWSQVVLPFRMRRDGVRKEADLEFGRAAGKVQRLDVYRPVDAKPGDRRPAILQIHGGGWVIGDKREQGIPLLGHLVANGWVGFNANYRLSPAATWPDHLVDLKKALAWIREHADEYGVDPDFVAVTGGSAGGHLTAMVALTANDPRYQPGFEDADTTVQAAVPFYGVYDFTDRQGVWHEDVHRLFLGPMVIKAFFDEEPEKFADASPLDHVGGDIPPFFVLHGDKDTLAPVEDARLFVDELRQATESPVVYAELKGAHHAFDLFVSARAKPVIESVERFLHAVHAGREAHIEEADVQADGFGSADVAEDPRPDLKPSTSGNAA